MGALRPVGLAILLCAALSAQNATGSTAAIVASYLTVQAQLAGDTLDGVKPEAARLAAEARVLGGEGAALAAAAAALEKADDIKAAREAFGAVSDAVIGRVRSDTAFEPDGDLRLAYCPMARRSWLQRGEQVRNPYYGAQMLTCGGLKPLR